MSYAGKKPRYEIQAISGSGAWDGSSGMIAVSGSGPRRIFLGKVSKPTCLTVIDRDGSSAKGPITIEGASSLGGHKTLVIDKPFGSYTLAALDTAESSTWVVVGVTPATHQHRFLQGLGEDHHPHYFKADGSRRLSGDLRFEGEDIPTGRIRVTRDGDIFDLLTSVLLDGTPRTLLAVRGNAFVFPLQEESPLVFEGSAPLRYRSSEQGVRSLFKGVGWAVESENALKTPLHQYGPTASSGQGLNLSYRAIPATTVAGLGAVNTYDNTRFLVQGLESDGSSFVYRGTNAKGETTFSVDDLGRTSVGKPFKRSHAVPLEFVQWVETASEESHILTPLGAGRVNIHLADLTKGPHSVILSQAPAHGDRVVIKDRYGKAALHPLTVNGGRFMIDGEPTRTLKTAFAKLSLYFTGDAWVVL